MHSGTQRVLESSYRTDLNSVRVHDDSHGQDLARSLSARAVTYGNHIFLGPGERQSDLRLMAHETAHVLQQQAAPVVHLWAPGEASNSYEHEAHRAADAVMRHESFNVQQRTAQPQAQRLGMSDALNYFADKANMIPGFRMFTIVIGMNPINGAGVDASPGNIVRAIVEFLPGGGLVVQALENSGVFDKVGNWVAGQLKSLGMVGSSFKTAITDFLKSLSWKDIFNLGGVWERAKSIFTTPVSQLISFVKGLISGIIQFIKDAILKPIAKLAEGTEGYALLKGILGKDPITGEPVPRTAETLLGPLLRMIGLGEVWSKMQQANAIPRCWAWFLSTMGQLVGFVSQIPGLFVAAFKSLTIEDIILVPKAFAKIANVFGGFIGKFVSWGVDAMFKLLEIVFDVVSPGAFGYIKKTGAALKAILKNPMPFIGNLVRAAKAGFEGFKGNFVTHLKTGLLDWLTGSLPGVYIPKSFSLIEFGKMALSILGISWGQIRGKIVKNLGPQGEMIMQGLEGLFDIVMALKNGGPAAAWEVIKEKLTNLKDTIVDGIIGMVKDAIVTKAIPKLVGMFIPGAGFIAAIISVYDTIMVFVNKISKIIQVVNAFINSIVQIAAGNIGAAAAKVESILAGMLALAINFLAGFAGLGKVADKVMGIINKVRGAVDKALDTAIAWIIGKAKSLFAALFKGKGKPDTRTVNQKRDDLKKGIAEAQALLNNPKLSADDVKKKLPGIKAKYKITIFQLVTDAKTEAKETDHIHGEIHSDVVADNGPTVDKTPEPEGDTSITISRPGFRQSLKDKFREKYPGSHKGQVLAADIDRRHMVSSDEMAKHLMAKLNGKKWSEAKKLLEAKPVAAQGAIPDKPKNADIQAAARARHREFFNHLENLWPGPSSPNRALGAARDPDPSMTPEAAQAHADAMFKIYGLD